MKYSKANSNYPLVNIDRENAREKFPEAIPCHMAVNNPFVEPSVKLGLLYTPEEFVSVEHAIGFHPYPLFCVIVDYLYKLGYARSAEDRWWEFERGDVVITIAHSPEYYDEFNFVILAVNKDASQTDSMTVIAYEPSHFFLHTPKYIIGDSEGGNS